MIPLDFIFLWAVVFIVTTTIILIYKKNNTLAIVADESELPLDVKESYQHLWKVLQIKPIQMVCLILVTCRVILQCIYLLYLVLKEKYLQH